MPICPINFVFATVYRCVIGESCPQIFEGIMAPGFRDLFPQEEFPYYVMGDLVQVHHMVNPTIVIG
jgi:hypothetical protein